MSREKLIQKISNYSFGIGFIASNLMRIPFFSQILAAPVAALYLVGYSAWYIASLYNDKTYLRKKDSWYGFATFRQQHQTAALLGTISALLSLFAPTLIVPTAWLYMTSNLFWSIGAFHLRSMPDYTDGNYSHARQTVFCYLTLSVTSISFISALTATCITCLPFTPPILLPISALVAGLFTLVTMGLLFVYQTGDFKPDRLRQTEACPASSAPRATEKPSEPKHHRPLFDPVREHGNQPVALQQNLAPL